MTDAIADHVVRAVFGMLINRTDVYLAAVPRSASWYCQKSALTPNLVLAALRGQVGLGIYTTSEVMTGKWLCLDVDVAEEVPALMRLAVRLAPGGNVLLERSRRGAHLWLFCPPTSWQDVRAVGRALAAQAGLGSVEVFPKWEGLNGVKLPGSRHPKSGIVYPAIAPVSGEVLDVRMVLIRLWPRSLPMIAPTASVRVPASSSAAVGERGEFVTLSAEVSRVTQLRQYGPERAIGRCPFHDDRHPSLSILGGFWRCWAGCGEGGLNAFRARLRERRGVPD